MRTDSVTTRLEGKGAANHHARLSESLVGGARPFSAQELHVIGVLPGEGVGPEVVPVALSLLDVLAEHSDRSISVHTGGEIGYPALARHGSSLSYEVIEFAEDVFSQRGALFCGPGGERFVYETRKVFDLYCKFTPLQPFPELRSAGVVRGAATSVTDIIAVRENKGGIYQGQWASERNKAGEQVATHRFEYTESMVRRILKVSLALAARRRGILHIVLKPGGIPSVSDLWRECAHDLERDFAVEVIEQEIDNAAYQLIANPAQFDVVVSPNMFGDVLADCGSLLLASRGLSFSGNYNDCGDAVYQTGHGAARDIAGRGIANPSGQILSLGMMLRESFDWPEADRCLRVALRKVLSDGYCTGDISSDGCTVVQTARFGELVRDALVTQLAGRRI